MEIDDHLGPGRNFGRGLERYRHAGGAFNEIRRRRDDERAQGRKNTPAIQRTATGGDCRRDRYRSTVLPLCLDRKDDIAEIDINPLMVFENGRGAKVVDCLMTCLAEPRDDFGS
jgi:hypothetical protein